MAHIASIGAGLFSTIMICRATTAANVDLVSRAGDFTEANWNTIFSDHDIASPVAIPASGNPTAQPFEIITNLREIPAFGTPANIVNVPVYGQSTSSQIQAQADAPSLEVTLNYVPSLWSGTSSGSLNQLLNDRTQVLIGITLTNNQIDGSGDALAYERTSTGIGTVENSATFFVGRMEALQITPSLSDTNQATLTLSAQSGFFGPFTV